MKIDKPKEVTTVRKDTAKAAIFWTGVIFGQGIVAVVVSYII